MWFKKKPLEPKRAALAEGEEVNEEKALLLLADIHKLDPSMRYVFWFDRAIQPERLELIRKKLLAFGVRCMIISGMTEPKIFEFAEEVNCEVVDWKLRTPQVVEAGQVPVYDKIGNAEEKKDA